VNLAIAPRDRGVSVGLLDADIYGPSAPMTLGVEDGAQRVRMTEDRVILPLDAQGISLVSFGFLWGRRRPRCGAGPLVSKAVRQFSRGVLRSAIDVLVWTCPPAPATSRCLTPSWSWVERLEPRRIRVAFAIRDRVLGSASDAIRGPRFAVAGTCDLSICGGRRRPGRPRAAGWGVGDFQCRPGASFPLHSPQTGFAAGSSEVQCAQRVAVRGTVKRQKGHSWSVGSAGTDSCRSRSRL